MRPTMRFVPVKSEETQGAAMVFRVRELLIRQRTQAINALRGHLTEFGQIVPQGAANAARLIAIVEDPDGALPADAVPTLKALIAALTHLEAEIRKLDAEIARRAKENDVARRLMTVPWSCASAAFDRRQAAARGNDEDGRTIPATPADHWRQQRGDQT